MEKIITWLTYLILFILPWQTHLIIRQGQLNNGPWEYGTINVYGTAILIVITFIFLVISKRKQIFNFKPKTHHTLFSIFLLYCLVTLPFSLSPPLSLYRLLIIIVGIFFVAILSKTKIPFRKLCLTIILGACLSGLLGIWQFFSQSTIASSWLGLALHNQTELGVSVIEAVAKDGITERWLRAYGSLDHPNMFGGLMALTFIVASWLWLFRENANNRIEGILLILSIVILSAATLVSFSRSAWLVASVGMVMLVLIFIKEKRNNWTDFSSWLSTIVIITLLIFSQYSYLFSPRLSGDTRLEQISTTERLDGLSTSKTLLERKSLFGYGLGIYTLALKELTPDKQSWFYQPVHNTFLFIAAETGLLGFVLLLASILFFLLHIYKRSSHTNRGLLITLSLGVIIIALFDHWLFSLYFGIIFSATILGLLVVSSKSSFLTE